MLLEEVKEQVFKLSPSDRSTPRPIPLPQQPRKHRNHAPSDREKARPLK
jgi:hypothetical protein